MKVLFAGKDSDTVSHYNWVYFFSCVLLIGLCLSLVWTGAVIIYFGIHPGEIRVLDTGSAFQVTAPWGGVIRMSYLEFPGRFYQTLPDGVTFLFVVTLTGILTRTLPYLLIVCFLMRILRSIAKAHTPFLPKAADSIRYIGYCFLVMGLLGKLIYQSVISVAVFGELFFENPIQWKEVFFAVLLLLLADIYKRGCALQQESDETL